MHSVWRVQLTTVLYCSVLYCVSCVSTAMCELTNVALVLLRHCLRLATHSCGESTHLRAVALPQGATTYKNAAPCTQDSARLIISDSPPTCHCNGQCTAAHQLKIISFQPRFVSFLGKGYPPDPGRMSAARYRFAVSQRSSSSGWYPNGPFPPLNSTCRSGPIT